LVEPETVAAEPFAPEALEEAPDLAEEPVEDGAPEDGAPEDGAPESEPEPTAARAAE
jgi:hypothetical protein